MSFHVRSTRDFWWLEKRLGPHFHIGPSARGIAAIDERTGQTVGMVAYDGWTLNSAFIHIALDTPIAWRTLSKAVFAYPFVEADRKLLIAMVASDNKRSLQLTEHVGFRPTYRIENAITDGVHIVIFEMRREACRWLEA